ncbi:MAG: SH3 domain-containing protein, partial [Ruminococcus sp.]|nr:SH3 domain-containing protein [Ruminococcus sp.]
MAIFKCKMCGGSLEIPDGVTVYECEYCGTRQTLPKISDDQKISMFNRANHFRQQCEFDKAAEIYEKLTAESEKDAELYWSLVLCRYGIEYVDDPVTKEKIPTSHRAQYKSILEDPDYHTALECADTIQRKMYEQEAYRIFNIQKGIIEISHKEQPYDVFICYKESDENGRRTPDSVLAQDLYYGLTQEGFKVFFSRITLESKLGTEYEPYIFAALNSSKVMVVLGTKPEYFNAVWVRNEWSRYLQLMQDDKSKIIIPAYKDMNPYDLPDSLSMFQSQDMSKIGFLQDLIRGIKKVINNDDNSNNSDVSKIITESRPIKNDTPQTSSSDFVKASSKGNFRSLIALASVFVIGVGITGGFFMMKNKGSAKPSVDYGADASVNTPPAESVITEAPVVINITEAAATEAEVQATQPAVDKQAVKEAYVKKLTEFAKSDDFNAYDHASKYALYDVDNDGIEELIIQYQVTVGNAEKLYYYKNGEYSEIASCMESSFTIAPNEHMVQCYMHGGGTARLVPEINPQGTTTEEITMVYPDKYTHNKKSITKEEYDTLNNKYNAINWVSPSFNAFSAVLPDSVVFAKPRETYAFLGAVNTESDVLNVREKPSMDGRVLGGLPKGTIIRVYKLDGYNDWYKIEWDEKNLKGYASAQYIVDSATYKQNETNSYKYEDESTMIAKGRTILNEGGVLNVRKSPSTDAEIITTIPKGHYVGIFSSTGDWYYVKYFADKNSPIYYG